MFEQAHGGTLFLDEIANLDLDLQRQLLLVLERGQVTRLGDTRPRPAAPKLVAATNQDVEALVRAGAVPRRSLHAAQPGHAPARAAPARAPRAICLIWCASRFSRRCGRRRWRRWCASTWPGSPPPTISTTPRTRVLFGRPRAAAARRDAFSVFVSREALARLSQHHWPGNHRELKLLAANALVFCLTRHLDTDLPAAPAVRAPAVLDIPDPLLSRLLGANAPRLAQPAAPAIGESTGAGRRLEIELAPAESFSRLSAAVERQYLRALFEACRGDLTKMARELLGPRGSPRQVHLRLNQLGLKLRDLRGTK